VTAAGEDLSGNLVVGTASGGLHWLGADGRVTRLTPREGLSHHTVISLCVDREGNLWAGTQGGGLNRIKRQVFEVLEETRGQTVLTVCEDAAGGVWVGTDGDGVLHRHPFGSERFGGPEGLINPQVLSLWAEVVVPARAGLLAESLVEWGSFNALATNVWAGTRASGLFELRGRAFGPAVGAEGLHAVVSALFRDRQGRLWCGTPGGLGLRTEPGWRLFTTAEGLTANEVRALADDAAGNLWIGTVGGGLNRWRDGHFTAFRKTDGLPSDDVSSLLVDDEGMLWVGTFGSGLARYRNGRWSRFTSRDGLPGNSIGAMLDDGQGSLWIGSNAGLARVPRAALEAFAEGRAPRVACRVYDRADGLPTREFPLGSQPAAWRGAEGRLWFASVRGLIAVNPDRLRPNLTPPPVVIEEVRVDGQDQGTNALRREFPQPLVIPPGRERLEIHFTSLNLGAPDRARFRYRLTPYEQTWVEAGGERVARYPQLPPGRYRFQVIASNEDGVWNDLGSTLLVEVLTPVWRQRWFAPTVAVALLALVAVAVRYFSTQRLQRQLLELKREEALEKERGRIAQDLHDQLGANLTQVAMLGELVEVDKDLPEEVAAHARQITQTARETTRTLDEIVWAVNPSNDTLEGLVTYLCKHAQEYLTVAGVRYRLEAPAELPAVNIPPDVRHNVFLAAKEAVTNIVRHSGASAARLRVKLAPTSFTIEIEDDGKGLGDLDEKAARNRNGLRGMRKRMAEIGGQFELGPAPQRGTVIRLTAPLKPRPRPG
jgi:signal transduction histidine kinase/streptogramin lyase